MRPSNVLPLERKCSRRRPRRPDMTAVVEIPILPITGLCVANRIESHIFRGNDESELLVGANFHQALLGQRPRSGISLVVAAGTSSVARQNSPVGILQRQQYLGATPHLHGGLPGKG